MANDFKMHMANDEPFIVDGDFVVFDGDDQNLEDLCELNPGELKADPLTGVGVIRMLKSNLSDSEIVSRTRSQMRLDNWEIGDVYLDNNELVAIGNRNED